MGLPAEKPTPSGDTEQLHTEILPDNVITWQQVMHHMDDLAARIGGQIKQEVDALRGEFEGKMKESEGRSKEYTDNQVDSIQAENREHISSIETLVSGVVSNVNKRLETVISGIETKLGQWNILFTSAQQSISNIHSVASDLQAGQRDLEKGQRHQAEQIDALQENEMEQVKIDAVIRSDLDAATRNTNQNTTLITNILTRFDPMVEHYRLEMEHRRQVEKKRQERQERQNSRLAVVRLLFGAVGSTRLMAVTGTVVTLLFAAVARVTGVDLNPIMQDVLSSIEHLLRGL